MGVFDDAKDKAKEAIDDLTGAAEARDKDAEAEEQEQEKEQEKAEILEEAQQAADEARRH